MSGLPAFDPNVLFNSQPRSAADDLVKMYLKNAQKEIEKNQKVLATRFEVEMSSARQDVMKWTPVTQSISDAQAQVDFALSKTDAIKKVIAKMRTTLTAGANNSSTDWAAVARTFDSLRTTINSSTHGGGSDNLVGSVRRGDTYAANSLTYETDPEGGQETIQGKYLGTDFDVTLPDNTFFRPSGAQAIQRYQAYPQGKVGYSQSVTDSTVTLTSYDTTTKDVAFTVGVNTAAPTSYTGTVQKRGIGILQSWMYDFSTAAGRQRALDDLSAATNKVTIQQTNFTSQKTLMAQQAAKAQAFIDAGQTKIIDLQNQAQVVLQTYVASAQQEAQANAARTATAFNNPALTLLQTSGRIGTLFDLTT
jgi:hypothetical protein